MRLYRCVDPSMSYLASTSPFIISVGRLVQRSFYSYKPQAKTIKAFQKSTSYIIYICTASFTNKTSFFLPKFFPSSSLRRQKRFPAHLCELFFQSLHFYHKSCKILLNDCKNIIEESVLFCRCSCHTAIETLEMTYWQIKFFLRGYYHLE